MSLADLISSVANVARNIVVPQGLTVQCRVTVGGGHTPYNPTTDTTTETGTVLEIPGLRYQENLKLTTGLTVKHHHTEGLVNYTEKVMFFATDLGNVALKQDDVFYVLAADKTTWERWQIKAVDTPPTNPIFIASIERS